MLTFRHALRLGTAQPCWLQNGLMAELFIHGGLARLAPWPSSLPRPTAGAARAFRQKAIGALSRRLQGLCVDRARLTGLQRLGPGRWAAAMELVRGANDGATTLLEFTRGAASLRLASQAPLPTSSLTGVHRDRAGREYRLTDDGGRPQCFDPSRREWRPVALPPGEGACTLSLQPDGHVYASQRRNEHTAVFRLEGSASRLMGRTPHFRGHAVLPDGRAFTLVQAGNDDRLLALGESLPRRVVAHPPQQGLLAVTWTHVTVAPDGRSLWLVPPSGGAAEQDVYRVDPAQVQPDGSLKAERLEMSLPQFTSGFVHTLEAGGRMALHVLLHVPQRDVPQGGLRTWCATWNPQEADWHMPGLLAGQGSSPVAVFVAGPQGAARWPGHRREAPVAGVLRQGLDALLHHPVPAAPLLPVGPVPRRLA